MFEAVNKVSDYERLDKYSYIVIDEARTMIGTETGFEEALKRWK